MERRQSLPRVMSSRFSSSTTTTTKLDTAAAARLSSTFSDHNSSLRRKSISFTPYKNYDVDESPNLPSHPSANSSLHRTPLSTTTVVAAVPSSLRRLQNQRSSDDIQNRGLWPSTKKPNPSDAAAAEADAATEAFFRHVDDESHITEAAEINNHIPPQRPSATYNASTFTSRQHKSSEHSVALEDRREDRGRRSLRYHILKKPATPPSPSSSSSSSSNGLPPSAPMIPGRLSLNRAAHARKRSDFSIDFPSTESERSEAAGTSPRITRDLGKVDGRRPISPAQGPGLPTNERSGGMGNLISRGLSNLFRRKSISGVNGESLKSMLSTAGVGSPGREAAMTVKAIGSPGRDMVKAAKSIGSPARETIKAGRSMGSPAARGAAVEGELQHKLRMMRNYLMQWRFVNAGTLLINKIKWVNTQRTLVSSWLGLSDLQLTVAQKRLQLDKEKLRYKVNKLLYYQTKALERWGTMERQHMAALSSTKDSLQTALCRIPLTDNAKVDQCSLSTWLQQATNLTAAINGSIATCNSRARATAPLVAELAQVVAREKPLLEECLELLGLVSTLQVHEESLRCHLIQLKPQ